MHLSRKRVFASVRWLRPIRLLLGAGESVSLIKRVSNCWRNNSDKGLQICGTLHQRSVSTRPACRQLHRCSTCCPPVRPRPWGARRGSGSANAAARPPRGPLGRPAGRGAAFEMGIRPGRPESSGPLKVGSVDRTGRPMGSRAVDPGHAGACQRPRTPTRSPGRMRGPECLRGWCGRRPSRRSRGG